MAEDALITAEDTKPTKRKRNRPDLAKFGEEYTEAGDNARYLRYARVSLSLPPIDIADPEQVRQRIGEYFDFCESNDRKPSMIGMANWLGVSRDTVASWRRGEYRDATHSALIKNAIGVLEELMIDYMQSGKVNPASAIFLSKNLFGYRDVQDFVLTPNTAVTEANPAEVAGKYAALPAD